MSMRAALLTVLLCSAALSQTSQNDTATLRQLDQSLLDAIAPGNAAVWDRALAPDAIYVDENGVIFHRAAFLAELKPLPAGASGKIRITDYQAHFTGQLATVIHKEDEDENYHGQLVHAQYLTTESWQRENGQWKLLLAHVYVVPHAPPSITLSIEQLKQYEGTYTGGPDLVYVIQLKGDHLEAGRPGKALSRLYAEAPDLFFIPDQLRNRKMFQRDSSGRITGFIDRREGQDLIWKKKCSSRRH